MNPFLRACPLLRVMWSVLAGTLLGLPLVAQIGPTVIRHPVSRSASPGDRVVFDVSVRGDSPLRYQWWFGEVPIRDANANRLVLSNLTVAMAGHYRVVVSNDVSAATSDDAVLDVDATFTKLPDHPVTRSPSAGASWVDFDGDGRLDLFSTSGAVNRLYRNEGGGRLTLQTRSTALSRFQGTGTQIAGGAWGDYDNDGLPDVFLPMGGEWTSGSRKNALFHNLGNGDFARVLNNPIVDTLGQAATAVWGDYDRDGWIDLIAPSIAPFLQPGGADLLFHNERNGQFTSIVNEEWFPDTEQNIDASWGDLDGDGDPDLVVSTRGPRSLLNLGDGTFEQIYFFNSPGPRARGIAFGDYDNDGDLDVFFTYDLVHNVLYRNDGNVVFTDVTNEAGVSRPEGAGSYSGSWADYDNDGWLDLFVANYTDDSIAARAVNTLFKNNGDGTFTRITTGSPVNESTQGTAGVWGDYDDDGFLDLLITYWDGIPRPPSLFHNNGNTHGWLKLRLVGTQSNRSALGAKVRLTATLDGKSVTQLREIGTGSPFLCQNDPRAHFGLGDANRAEEILIEWPSGRRQTLSNVAAKQILTITEPDGQLRVHLGTVGEGALGLYISGDPGANFVAETSSDLRDWKPFERLGTAQGQLDQFGQGMVLVASPHEIPTAWSGFLRARIP